jgi:hypothetical protein
VVCAQRSAVARAQHAHFPQRNAHGTDGSARAEGKGVTAIPYAGRPDTPAFDGTWAGDVGFDPLVISGNLDMKWLREAELKHGRVAMLAAAGSIAQARPPATPAPRLRTRLRQDGGGGAQRP